jgi:hypothetical protein
VPSALPEPEFGQWRSVCLSTARYVLTFVVPHATLDLTQHDYHILVDLFQTFMQALDKIKINSVTTLPPYRTENQLHSFSEIEREPLSSSSERGVHAHNNVNMRTTSTTSLPTPPPSSSPSPSSLLHTLAIQAHFKEGVSIHTFVCTLFSFDLSLSTTTLNTRYTSLLFLTNK